MFLNIIQLAESLGVEESVVEGWIRNEGLPCVRDSGRMLFDRAQVVDWAAERGLAARTGFLAPGLAKPGAFLLEKLLRTGGIHRQVAPENVLRIFAEALAKLPSTTPAIRQVLIQRVGAPKAVTWAPIGDGWALPHLRSHIALGGESGLAALLVLKAPVSLPEPLPDHVPVTRLIFFLAPTPRAHLEVLARLSGLLARGDFKQAVAIAAPDDVLYAAVSAASRGGP